MLYTDLGFVLSCLSLYKSCHCESIAQCEWLIHGTSERFTTELSLGGLFQRNLNNSKGCWNSLCQFVLWWRWLIGCSQGKVGLNRGRGEFKNVCGPKHLNFWTEPVFIGKHSHKNLLIPENHWPMWNSFIFMEKKNHSQMNRCQRDVKA